MVTSCSDFIVVAVVVVVIAAMVCYGVVWLASTFYGIRYIVGCILMKPLK